MKKIILLIVLGYSIAGIAQSKLERADKYFDEFKFEKAIALYHDLASESRKTSTHVIQRLADAHFNMSEYQNAKDWYVKLYAMQGQNVGEDFRRTESRAIQGYPTMEKASFSCGCLSAITTGCGFVFWTGGLEQ